MAKQFTIAELEARVAIEKGDRHVTTQDRNGHETSYAPPKSERDIRRAIYDLLWEAADWRSRADIAKGLDLKKTGWLHSHIEQLVADGYIVKEKTVRHNGMPQFWYAVAR